MRRILGLSNIWFAAEPNLLPDRNPMTYTGPVDTLGVLWPNTVSCSLFDKKKEYCAHFFTKEYCAIVLQRKDNNNRNIELQCKKKMMSYFPKAGICD